MSTNCHDHDQPEIPGYWHSLDKGAGNQYTGGKFSAGKYTGESAASLSADL